MINANDVKKDLYKSKNMAKFSHYCKGNLYYNVELMAEENAGTYQFPIPVVEEIENMDKAEDGQNVFNLSSDLGDTPFAAEVKGSDLNRWIAKAIGKEEFIKIG